MLVSRKLLRTYKMSDPDGLQKLITNLVFYESMESISPCRKKSIHHIKEWERIKKTLRTFWLSLLNLLPHCCKTSRPYLVPVPNYWTWTKTTFQKSQLCWSNPYKIYRILPNRIWVKWCNFIGEIVKRN